MLLEQDEYLKTVSVKETKESGPDPIVQAVRFLIISIGLTIPITLSFSLFKSLVGEESFEEIIRAISNFLDPSANPAGPEDPPVADPNFFPDSLEEEPSFPQDPNGKNGLIDENNPGDIGQGLETYHFPPVPPDPIPPGPPDQTWTNRTRLQIPQYCNGAFAGGANFQDWPSMSPAAIRGVVPAGNWVVLTGGTAYGDGVIWYEAINETPLVWSIEPTAQNQTHANQLGWIANCFVE